MVKVFFFLKASYIVPISRDAMVLIAAGLGHTVWIQREPGLPQAPCCLLPWPTAITESIHIYMT